MSELSFSGDAMLAWNEKTAKDWYALLADKPEILSLPCDIYKAKTVAELLQHIVAVELRYGQRLAGMVESPYEDVPCRSADEIFATHERAAVLLRALVADTSYDWESEMEFMTISSGRLRASRRAMFIHVVMHSMRHYAQLATLVRQHGFTPGFAMDYLMLEARPA
jgi:uncharacterized damage-inducible protein DinB